MLLSGFNRSSSSLLSLLLLSCLIGQTGAFVLTGHTAGGTGIPVDFNLGLNFEEVSVLSAQNQPMISNSCDERQSEKEIERSVHHDKQEKESVGKDPYT